MGDKDIYKRGFGSPGRTKEFDDEARAKSKGVTKKRRWTREYCLEQLGELLDSLKKILVDTEKTEVTDIKLKREIIRDANTMMNRVLDFMRYLYPPVQQSVNVNIDTTSDAVIERLQNWKKEQVVVMGEENE